MLVFMFTFNVIKYMLYLVYNSFFFRLLCTVVSLFYVCVVYRHVRIVRTCDRVQTRPRALLRLR